MKNIKISTIEKNPEEDERKKPVRVEFVKKDNLNLKEKI